MAVLLFLVPPYLADGFRVVYDREVPFELRVQESADGPQQVGTLEAIKVKVLMLVRRTCVMFPHNYSVSFL